jgi:hypothetical protein
VLWKSLQAAELNDEEIEKVSWANAARWYQFDPFEHRTREECTVGALRALAHDVDTTPREYGAGDHHHTHALQQTATNFIADTAKSRGSDSV